jgi:hypothetical protein
MALYLGINGCGIDSQAELTSLWVKVPWKEKKKGGLWGRSPCVTLFHEVMGEKKD